MAQPPPTTITTTATTTTTASPPPQQPPCPPTPSWGTLEELLLTCAVNRHGTNSWSAVADELNNLLRTTLFTPLLCRHHFLLLLRRFTPSAAAVDGDSSAADATVWVHELRRLRVAELKRDLHRYDLSIVSLQLKVKRLKEERENSDLKITADVETSPSKTAEKNAVLFGGLNSLDRKIEPGVELVKPVEVEPDREVGPVCVGPDREVGVGSCNGSSNTKESGRVESGEVGESGSDVQSTASLQLRREKEKEVREGCENSSGGEENQSLGSKFSGGGGGGHECKSRGLIDFLDAVRTRLGGSIFEGRLESQETPKYKSLIKEHIDLGIVRKRVEEGRYSNCYTMFYRDLMLLVNNAVVFFSKTSSEHKFAVELRQLINQHFQTHLSIKNGPTLTPTTSTIPTPSPPLPTKPEVNQADRTDLKPKLAITGPVIACRKRTSIAVKLLSSEAVKKESSPATARPASSDMLKKEGDKSLSTSFNAVAKKQSRDHSSAPRNPSGKNQSSHPTPNQKPSPRKASSKGETSETKADIKKLSSRNSKPGSRPGKDLLLDVLDSAVKRKIFGNGSSSGSLRSNRHKDQGRGSHSGLNRKPSTEKGKEERDSSRNKNNGRQVKKAAPAVILSGKRGRDGGKDSDAHAKKRHKR
ncbi:hypothetical protein vseg_008155 [Gypsophila vaccaria]